MNIFYTAYALRIQHLLRFRIYIPRLLICPIAFCYLIFLLNIIHLDENLRQARTSATSRDKPLINQIYNENVSFVLHIA